MTCLDKILIIIDKLIEDKSLFEIDKNIAFIEKRIKDFKTLYSKRKDDYIDRLDLIKLIIDLKVLNLEDVKQMYEACNYPFYYDKPLGDHYDVVLEMFVENNLFDGNLPDIYCFKNFKSQGYHIVDDHEKYETVFKYYLLTRYQESMCKFLSEEEHLVYNLAILEEGHLDVGDNIFDLIYPDCEELDKFRNYLLDYDMNCGGTHAPNYEDIIHIILLTVLDNYYEGKTKTIKGFRRVIADVSRSIYKKVFMNKVYLEEMFSHNFFENFYKKTFLGDDYEEKDRVITSLFKKIFANLKTVDLPVDLPDYICERINYKFINLPVDEMVKIFKHIKHSIDAGYQKVSK